MCVFLGASSSASNYSSYNADEVYDGEDWEEQLVRRGMRVAVGETVSNTARKIATTSTSKKNQLPSSAHTTNIKSSSDSGMTIIDFELALIEAINGVRENNLRNARRYEMLEVDLTSCVAEEESLRTALEAKVKAINDELLNENKAVISDNAGEADDQDDNIVLDSTAYNDMAV
jgi:hypothetical protein